MSFKGLPAQRNRLKTKQNIPQNDGDRPSPVSHITCCVFWIFVAATLGGACTNADVFRLYEPPAIPEDRIVIQGTYCASEPEDLVFPVKILFIFDDSGSMAESDPAFRRLQAARELVAALLQEDEVYFGVEHFQNAQPLLLTTDPVFTRDQQIIAAALADEQHSPAGGTPYVGALSTAITAIKSDINENPILAGRTRYVVIFLSDGEPTDDTSPPYSQIMDRVNQLEQLEHGSPPAGEVTLHTAYLESNGDDSGGSHVLLLQQMAEATGGQFRDFESGEDIDFSGFDVTAISRDYQAIFPVLVSNLNVRTTLTGLAADSDADGLSDAEEQALGTDPTLADSDGDGCSDLMEARYANWDPLTPGWLTEPAHCDCSDELRYRDTDGDGLSDCEEKWLSLDWQDPDSDLDAEGNTQPDHMLDRLEVLWHLGRTRYDSGEDYDRDGVNNLDELASHMDPNISDNDQRDELAYRYEYIYQQVDHPNCYDFRVSNVRVVRTLASGDLPAGSNRIFLYFTEAPQDDPHRERTVKALEVHVNFDGWQPEPALVEVTPEDFQRLDQAGDLGGPQGCGGDGCPPQAQAGPDQEVSDSDSDGIEQVLLDGSGSFDPDGTITGYLWREQEQTIATSRVASVEMGVGEHEIELVVVDDAGNTASDTVHISITAPTSTSTGPNPLGQGNLGGCASAGAGAGSGLLLFILASLAWLAGRRRSRLYLLLLLAAGCGPEHPLQLGIHGLPIINGSPDTDPAHQAVVALTFGQYMCTGTLISPDVILTAAHCVKGYRAADYTVYFGRDIQTATTRRVSEVKYHPQYNENSITNDIAVLRLSSPPPAGVTPIPYLPASLAMSSADVSRPLEFVGYGQDEYNQVGRRLTITDTVDWICTNPGGCTVGQGYLASANTICSDQNDGGTCHGDSGGPAFIERNGTTYVAGVTSYGDQYCQYFGCSTKVDAFEAFIADFVGGVLGSPCTAAAQCDSGHCVEGVCCESSCSGTCMTCKLAGSAGLCLPAPDGTPCPDGNACNGEEVCLLQECVSGEPLDCDDDNPCSTDACDPLNGCVHAPLADGTSCADEDLCNGQETCQAGMCSAGEALDCDDGNPCTTDGCDALAGCNHRPLPDGSDCSQGLCAQASCQQGRCLPADGYCDDDNPCTSDTCLPESGCQHQPLADGTRVEGCQMCAAGLPADDPDCVVAGGCGCASSTPSTGQVLWWLLFLPGLLRRRRPA